jgi:DNA-binding NarL/FixJ family response regulator
MKSSPQVRIILADDHAMMREGLRAILEGELGYAVIAQAGNGRETVALVKEHRPDLVIMDISMPDMNGIEATRQVIQELPGTKVIALSMHADKRFVGEMLGAGAAGYILKQGAMDELQLAIQTVLSGKTYISPDVAGTVIQDYVAMRREADGGTELTAKEREVLQLIAEGLSTKEIAQKLSVSVPTIETHRAHIMGKLQLHTVAELTKYAIRIGLTSLE